MRGTPLRRQLILVAVAGLLPLAISCAIGLGFLFDQQRHAEQLRTLEIARALASAVESELNRSVAGLQVMAAAVEQDDLDLDSFYNLAQRTLKREPQWRALILADRDGRQVAHSEFERGKQIPRSLEPASVAHVFESGKPVVGGLVRGRAGWAFAVRVPVMKDGKVHYVLSAVLSPKPMLDIVMRQKVNDDWVISVFDQSGLRVARSKAHEKQLGARGSEGLQKLLATPAAEGTGMSVTVEGDSLFTAFARVPDSGWTVVMGLPQALITGPALRSTRLYAVAVALSILAGLAVAFFYARRLEGQEQLLRHEQLARSQAEAANRAKDQFLAMLGHELRNPIAAISNATHLMEMGSGDPAVVAKARGIVRRQVTHLARLTDDLLDAARAVLGKIELRRQPVDLAIAAANALASVSATGRGARHHIESHLDEAWIEGDGVRLEQVICNLLVNAVKYTPEGGHVVVRTGVEGDDACVSVSDDGIGMSPDLSRRAFDLFVQGPRDIDRSQGGLGIGLTLVRRVAELHGGTATVQSAGDGQGSTFHVRIPAIVRPADAGAPQPLAARRALSVLIIEDNEDARESLQALLEMQGHRVEAARDGVTGLEKALALAPNVAIIDLGLPLMDGFEVARRMRASSLMASTYLIALTGYGAPEDRAKALESGFDEHLTKPVSPETLVSLLAKLDDPVPA